MERAPDHLYHRGYQIGLYRQKHLRCVYMIDQANFWLPRAFVWLDKDNRSGLTNYIDAMTEKRMEDASVWVRNGLVAEILQAEDPWVDVPIVRISPQRLLAVLRGEDPLEVHANAQLLIVGSDADAPRYLVPRIVAQSVGVGMEKAHVEAFLQRVDARKPVFYIPRPPEELRKLYPNLTPYPMHTGVNVALGEREGAAPAQHTDAPASEDETVLYARDKGVFVEAVSVVSRKDEPPYFVRRLMRGDHQLWCGTALSAHGPWEEHWRDSSRLAALGIVIGANQ